jgi:hypothetical protein
MKRISLLHFAVAAIAVLSSVMAAHAVVRSMAGDVTLTGKVTCSQCLALSLHKGFTPWSWAMYKLSQGDNVVLVTSDQAYKLEGQRQLLTKYVEEKATVSGHLDSYTIAVTNITHPTKEK